METSFEALVYDERDMASDHPESSLGHYDIYSDALDAIRDYLARFPEMCIYKVEVVRRA